MAFDKRLDVVVASREVMDDGKNCLTVSIHQYDGGVPKVQIKREVTTKKGERKFAKLGRLHITELSAVLEGLKWAVNELTETRYTQAEPIAEKVNQ